MQTNPYQGTITPTEWRDLLDAAQKMPWMTALEMAKGPLIRSKKSWFTNERKALFYRNISLVDKRCFLDIGAGSGIISAELAQDFVTGVSIDFFSEIAKFLHTRFKQDQIRNVDVVRADGLRLPFRQGTFNLIVVNGVLEWVGQFIHGKSCRRTQIEFLEECRRCLKKGGAIGIAIENRWNFDHFMGASPHGELPFVVVMPRPLARLITLIVRKEDYRIFIYSYFGYKRLLNRTGFKNIKIYLALPSYHSPEFMLTFSAEQERLFFGDGRPLLKRQKILTFVGMWRFFEHSFFIQGEI